MVRLPLGALVASLSIVLGGVLGCAAPPEPDRAARRTTDARPGPTEFAVPEALRQRPRRPPRTEPAASITVCA